MDGIWWILMQKMIREGCLISEIQKSVFELESNVKGCLGSFEGMKDKERIELSDRIISQVQTKYTLLSASTSSMQNASGSLQRDKRCPICRSIVVKVRN
ncbi:unnamed protein product [Moneuplotes crassus]|uniref:Uncharacterized protein n=1 Tax=Euplotes crassus TaxID=5936 RepID=A0AAD1URZ3_EUPCR|nr:unnamed protein product [Moneuplotes crassus]